LRPAANPEALRLKPGKVPTAKNDAAKVGQSPDPTRKATADSLGIGLPTLRSWEQHKRHQPSGHLTQSPSANP